MTETEIMKALECCCDRKTIRCIKECPLRDFDGECYTAMKQDILALINRKNAEIEELQIKNEHLAVFLAEAYKEIEDKEITARAEAIKEFTERVKAEFIYGWESIDCSVDDLYQIAKEMGVELWKKQKHFATIAESKSINSPSTEIWK